jgi:hypothetical protein
MSFLYLSPASAVLVNSLDTSGYWAKVTPLCRSFLLSAVTVLVAAVPNMPVCYLTTGLDLVLFILMLIMASSGILSLSFICPEALPKDTLAS